MIVAMWATQPKQTLHKRTEGLTSKHGKTDQNGFLRVYKPMAGGAARDPHVYCSSSHGGRPLQVVLVDSTSLINASYSQPSSGFYCASVLFLIPSRFAHHYSSRRLDTLYCAPPISQHINTLLSFHAATLIASHRHALGPTTIQS